MKYIISFILLLNVIVCIDYCSKMFNKEPRIAWSTYTVPYRINGSKILVVTGLREDGVLVWKKCPEIKY